MIQITLYTKTDCSLCDAVKADLTALQPQIGFTLLERDIEEDPEDFKRFRYLIPVVDISDGPMLYAPITSLDLQEALLYGR